METLWIVTLIAIFGVRIGEAMARTTGDLIGDADTDSLLAYEDLIKQAMQTCQPKAFLIVDTAIKKPIRNKELARQHGEAEDDPKSGPYVAACLNMKLAEFLVEVIERRSEKDEPVYTEQDYPVLYHRVAEAIRNSVSPVFNKFSPHDFRRLSTTMKIMQVPEFHLIGRLHGHSAETSKKYHQQGLEMNRVSSGRKFKPIGA